MPRGHSLPPRHTMAKLKRITGHHEHFEAYTYRRDIVHIETDHQPVEAIVQKPIDNAPSQQQCILL